MWEKLKSWLADDVVFYSLLVVLVGLVGYGLGQRSVAPLTDTITPAAVVVHEQRAVEPESTAAGVTVVASRSGAKYHLPECPGATQIKPENRITFPSRAAATAAGYTPAANCPEL